MPWLCGNVSLPDLAGSHLLSLCTVQCEKGWPACFCLVASSAMPQLAHSCKPLAESPCTAVSAATGTTGTGRCMLQRAGEGEPTSTWACQ